MKRIILIGTIGCGKTTFSQALLGEELNYKKTQAVEIAGGCILDTPGEYLERVQMRGHLMMTSVQADVIILLQSATDMRCMYSPCYAGAFAKDVIGIVTKTDIATEKQIEHAVRRLEIAGAGKIFRVSSYTKDGIREVLDYLTENE